MEQDKQQLSPFAIVNMLRVVHKEFAKPVCLVSRSTQIVFEDETYLPYPFTIEVLGEESKEFWVEFGDSMPLGVLRRIGKCRATLFSAVLVNPLQIISRIEGKLVYREGKAVFVVRRAIFHA